MILHYLSLAWQQLEKYRLQSLVSIVSLAIGFACFAFAAMWIKYETTYDTSFKDADRLHVILRDKSPNSFFDTDIRTLRELPQLERLSYVRDVFVDSINGKRIFGTGWIMNDTNLVSLLGLDLLEGSTSFVHNENEVAISDQLARQLWGDESPIGKEMVTVSQWVGGGAARRTLQVTAVFRYWGDHSNFPHINYLCHPSVELPRVESGTVFAHISSKVDMDALNAHLDTMNIYIAFTTPEGRKIEFSSTHEKMEAVPITKVRHSTNTYLQYARTKLNHIYLFAIAGGLLIICGLLNYLTLFINRLFIRKREMALRMVFGATGKDLILQFLTEYGLLLIISLLFGLFVINASMEWFLNLSELPKNQNYFFYGESLIYFALVFVVSMIVSIPVIWYFRRQSLQSNISSTGGLVHYHIFRRISTGVQIGISILCIFCSIVLLKQLNTLRHGDIGFERENRITHYLSFGNKRGGIKEELVSFLNQCSEVDTAFTSVSVIFPRYVSSSITLTPEKHPELTETIKLSKHQISDDLVEFYGLTLLQGRWLLKYEQDVCVVNETFVHQMGWNNPLEKNIYDKFGRVYRVVGVVKDFYDESPTLKNEYDILLSENQELEKSKILIRYKPGKKQELTKKIEAFFKDHNLLYNPNQWNDLMKDYDDLLISEYKLQFLLSITTIVCILIALFGVWSMIMLTCEQRRKEIAVRKVFGATTKDILDMFIVEYMALQGAAALVAFPVGYACMKPWLEQYVVQTSIPWWIYVGIFMAVALLVAICVGWRVWKTATAHPADEICKG